MRRGRRFSVTLAALFLAASAVADDGYWAYPGGGSWVSAGNWDSGTTADGADNTAYFGLSFEPTIPANATFTLDGARTIGNLVFTASCGPDNWMLNTGSDGPLTLDATFDLPAWKSLAGAATPTVPRHDYVRGINSRSSNVAARWPGAQ